MIVRKTSKTVQKRIYRSKYDREKTLALYRRTTFWFLFIPVYSYDAFID